MSEIRATHGVTTLMKAPEQNPYSKEYTMSLSMSLAVVQHAIVNNPLKNAEGTRRLKCPMRSDSIAGAIRPKTPPALRTVREMNAVDGERERPDGEEAWA
ncbi:hypothetical protein PQX77_019007 [Marasmius sp. AFHP31]|nr:hypothetical protein PQX77_019007 [Marasmius sp. AFHP31]